MIWLLSAFNTTEYYGPAYLQEVFHALGVEHHLQPNGEPALAESRTSHL